jgi:hypothetical protein
MGVAGARLSSRSDSIDVNQLALMQGEQRKVRPVEYILIIIITGMTPVSANFDTNYACREAGKAVVADFPQPKKDQPPVAKFYCFPKGS